MRTRSIISLLIFVGATVGAGASDGRAVVTPLWLSQTSVYQWRSSFGAGEVGEQVSRDRLWVVEFLFGRADLAQPSQSFLRDRPEAISRAGVFGFLAPFPPQRQPTPSTSVKRLMKIGSERQWLQDLYGPHGSLSVSNVGKSLADPEIIVRGVNEDASAPTVETEAMDGGSRLWAEPPAQVVNPRGRPRIVDASEGTPLDPLLNTTYDLNYPKVVPSMKDLSKGFPEHPSKQP